MIAGLMFSADLAKQWAEYARRVTSGPDPEKIITRLSAFLTEKEIASIGAYYADNALTALARALLVYADTEPTDPDVEIAADWLPRL